MHAIKAISNEKVRKNGNNQNICAARTYAVVCTQMFVATANDTTNNLDERIGSAANHDIKSNTYNKNATIAGIKQ